MIINPHTEVKLGPDARAELKELWDKHGTEIMKVLAFMCPESIATSVEQAALTGQNRAGYEKALENIIFLITPQGDEVVGTPATDYPSLDDDKAWEEQDKKKT